MNVYKSAISVNYTQFIVHRTNRRPGHIWKDEHVAQGFAWSDGSVSFGVPDHDGECLLEVDLVDELSELGPAVSWAVGVPFSAGSGLLKVGTVGIVAPIAIPAGDYGLAFLCFENFEVGDVLYPFRVIMAFINRPKFSYAILKSGPGLQTDRIQLERADPA
jgi:hypothetical protein